MSKYDKFDDTQLCVLMLLTTNLRRKRNMIKILIARGVIIA